MAVLKLKCGDDNTVQFTITDSAGDAVDITGSTIKFKIDKNLDTADGSAMYFGSYTSLTSPGTGVHAEVIPDSTSGSWTPGNYKFQARVIDSSGIVTSEDVDICILQQNLVDNE